MEKRKILTAGNKIAEEWRADRRTFIAPIITQKKRIDGVRFYFTSDGRQFIAEVFDKMFNPPRSKMKARFYKGRNPARTIA